MKKIVIIIFALYLSAQAQVPLSSVPASALNNNTIFAVQDSGLVGYANRKITLLNLAAYLEGIFTLPTLSGDVTNIGNAITLKTVNSNVGSFTNANITVNAKGLITAASNGSGGSGGSGGGTITIAALNTYNKTSADSVCTGTADQNKLNGAITTLYNAGGGTIKILAGNYSYNSSLVFKSNVNLIFDKNAVISLASSSNSTMGRNSHWAEAQTGDSNITIEGGIWKGNGTNQTTNYAVSPDSGGYFGWGIVFHRGYNITLKNMVFDTVRTVGIYLLNCHNVTVDNIQVHGTTLANNAGVIAAGGSQIKISNIDGITNDDLTALSAGRNPGDEYGGSNLYWYSGDQDSVWVTNVHSGYNGSIFAYRPISIGLNSGAQMSNIYLSDFTGSYHNSFAGILIYNFMGATNSKLTNLNIKNVVMGESSNSTSLIMLGLTSGDSTVTINDMFCNNNILLNYTGSTTNYVYNLHGRATKFIGSNSYPSNMAGISSTNYLLKTSRALGLQQINLDNCPITYDMHRPNVLIDTTYGAGTIRLFGQSIYTNQFNKLGTPTDYQIAGDLLFDYNYNSSGYCPVMFNGTNWISLITGSTIY